MGNLVSNISWFKNPEEEKCLLSSCADYTHRDVPALITDSNIELSLSVVNSEPLENFKIGENDSVINPLNDQPAETTIAIMPKIRARPNPKPRSVQMKERALMFSDDSLSQNTFHKVTGTIKPLPNRPSFFAISDSSTDEDTDYEPDENEAQNAEETKIEEAKKINPNPSEVSVPRTLKLDKNGQPIYEKCQCYWHRHRNVFID